MAVDGALATLTRQRLREESRAAAPGTVAVIGLGALGGRELSYGPDLELLFVYETTGDPPAGAAFFEKLRDDVSQASSGQRTG